METDIIWLLTIYYFYKVELENTLEKEQEGLVNRLWKKMDKLETEKRLLQVHYYFTD